MARQVAATEQAPGTTRTLLRGKDGSAVKRTVLPGGLRVVTEAMPGVRSVAFGLWVNVGSRDESRPQAGCSHYLEHLLFKGTSRRTALDISSTIDSMGGEINAFTTKEYTCFYARVLDTDLPVAIDVVSDMVLSSLVLAPDVGAERGVILEEIAMHDDDPADVVHDSFAMHLFGDTPLGRPILGSVESIESLSPATIRRYYRNRYRPEQMVVAAAGNLNHAAVVRQVRSAFARGDVELDPGATVAVPRIGARRSAYGSGIRVLPRTSEQASFVLGVPGVSRTDDRRFAVGVLSTALGGGMSSRLFQEVREKRGLAYSVYSYNGQYADAGLFGVYAGCLPKKVGVVLEICRDQLADVVANGVGEDEVSRGKSQLRGALVLGLEDTGSRMSRIGKSELLYGEMLGVDDILARIEAVTPDDVRDVATSLLKASPMLTVIGPFDEDRDFSEAVA